MSEPRMLRELERLCRLMPRHSTASGDRFVELEIGIWDEMSAILAALDGEREIRKKLMWDWADEEADRIFELWLEAVDDGQTCCDELAKALRKAAEGRPDGRDEPTGSDFIG